MVTSGMPLTRRAGLALVTLLMIIGSAQAAVTARLDRNAIDLNESFMLEIVVDTEIDLQPDISALHEDFYVGQSSQLSNTMIVNNQLPIPQGARPAVARRCPKKAALSCAPVSSSPSCA